MIRGNGSCTALLFTLLIILAFPAGVHAPQAVVRGRVLDDASDAPIADARVSATRSGSRRPVAALTDGTGHFVLPLGAGAYALSAERLGFAASRPIELSLGRGDTVHVEIRLDVEAILLAPITVVARPAPRHVSPGLSGFHERMEQPIGGWYMSREQIEARGASDVSHLLTGSGFSVVGGGRGVRAIVGGRANCPPEVYLDGRRLTSYERAPPQLPELKHRIATEALDFINPTDLEGVEVYQGAASVPGEFGGSTAQCGVIAFWSRRGS